MVSADVINHLEKYFRLSQKHFKEVDYALAAFFAITTIEETAKVLILHGTHYPQPERRQLVRETFSHHKKYFSALINLIDQSQQYKEMPSDWQNEVDSWWDTEKLMKLRNDALYMSLNKNEQLKTPTNEISAEQAALLVYIAGVALAELGEYISGLPSGWKKSILKTNKEFRKQFMQS